MSTAERALIGALVLGAPVPPGLRADDLVDIRHRLIMAAAASLPGGAADYVTLTHALEGRAQLEAAGGHAYLGELVRNTANAENADTYAAAVIEAASRRRMTELLEQPTFDAGEYRFRLEAELERLKGSSPAPLTSLLGLTAAEIMAPIPPESFLLPGVPAESYTLIAGALSSFKTTLLMYLLVWKATGYDLLDLDPHGNGCDIGPTVLVSYEDTDRRIKSKLQKILQQAHQEIVHRHGAASGNQFLARAEKHLKRVPLAGNADAGIVTRVAGRVVPNEAFLAQFFRGVRQVAERDVLIAIDPLRLALVGSQNDDDGADTVVHTLNKAATDIPGSGLVCCSHTTKAGAQEPAEGYAGAAYATSGSALYSQHARSNFLMMRLKSAQIAEMFDRADVTALEIERQSVVQLIHGRLSHGAESGSRYLLMRDGTLSPLTPRSARSAGAVADASLPALADAINRLNAEKVPVSKKALESDETLRAALGTRASVREAIDLAAASNWITFAGTTSDRAAGLTEAGRERLTLAKDFGDSAQGNAT